MRHITIAVGDTHFPFCDKTKLASVYRLVERHAKEIKNVVQMGDLYDMYSWGKYPRSLNIYTPAQELKEAHYQASKFWERIGKLVPHAARYQVLGNHDVRPLKRLLEAAADLEDFMQIEEYFAFEGVKTQGSAAEELMLDEICYMHGFRKFGDHVKHNMVDTVCGHLHRGGVFYMRHGDKVIWELNCGFLGLINSVAFSYTQQRRFAQFSQGIGWIDKYGPRFISL